MEGMNWVLYAVCGPPWGTRSVGRRVPEPALISVASKLLTGFVSASKASIVATRVST